MIGSQLKLEIKKLGLTHSEAAERLGISRNTLSIWFGKSNLDEAVLHQIKTKLGIDVSLQNLSKQAYDNDLNAILRKRDAEYIEILQKTITLLENQVERLEKDIERLENENVALRQRVTTSNAG